MASSISSFSLVKILFNIVCKNASSIFLNSIISSISYIVKLIFSTFDVDNKK